MSDSGIQPGDFVQYAHLGASGIGKVIGAGDSLLVQFWNKKEERKSASGLMPLSIADAGPVELLWNSPKDLTSWAKEKPLKLVALALFIDGRKGNPGKIKEKLDGWVPLGADWKTWWAKRAKSLNALSALPEPEYFNKSAKGNEYTLLCGIGDVPDDVQPPITRADWEKWLRDDTNLPTFGRNPNKAIANDLAKWSEDTIARILMRLLWGANLLLNSSKKPTASAASAWLNAVGNATLRWSKLYPGNNQLTERSGKVLNELARYIKGTDLTLFQAGVLSENPDRQRQLEQQRQEQEYQQARYKGRLEGQLQEQARQRADYAKRLEWEHREQERRGQEHVAEVKGLQAELDGERAERERLHGLLSKSNKGLEANRKQSRLEIRQDMLLAVGEVLQTVVRRQASSIDELAGNVEAGLTLAIKAGEAELLNTAPEGKVVAPGVQVRGIIRDKNEEDGFKEVVKVLLKPQVKQEVG